MYGGTLYRNWNRQISGPTPRSLEVVCVGKAKSRSDDQRPGEVTPNLCISVSRRREANSTDAGTAAHLAVRRLTSIAVWRVLTRLVAISC